MKWAEVSIPLFLALLILGCSVKEPGSPTWEVELTIPIADRVYSLSEIVDDSAEVAMNDSLGAWVSMVNDSILRFNFADSIGPTNIYGKLQHDPITQNIENYVGTMEVDPPGTRATFYLIGDVNSALPPGQYPFGVPSFGFGQITKTLLEFDEYRWVILDPEKSSVDSMWNTITITLTNWFPFALDSIMVDVYSINSTGTDSNLVFTIDTVFNFNTGDVYVKRDTLPSGSPIYSNMVVHLGGHSPGVTNSVTITEDDRIDADVELSRLFIERAKAHVARHEFFEDSIYISEEVDILESAVVREGFLSYYIDDQTGFADSVIFIMADFTLNGDTLKLIHFIEPNGTVQVDNLDLAGYEFHRPQRDGKIEAKIRVIIKDTANPLYYPDPPFVIVDNDSAVRADFSVSELTFQSFTGEIVDPKTVEIEPHFQALEDVPEGLDSIDVSKTLLNFALKTYVGASVDINLTVRSYRDGAIAVELPYYFTVPNAYFSNGTWTPGIIDTTFDGLNQLFNILPDSIGAFGEATVAGEVNVHEEQEVEGVFTIYTPFSFILGETLLEPEYTSLEEGFEDVVRQVDFSMFLESHVPLLGEVYIVSSSDTSFNPAVAAVDTLLKGYLPTPIVDSFGFVIEASDTAYQQTLNYDLLQIIAGASETNPIHIKTLLKINSTEGDTVRFNPYDYVSVGAATHVIIEVDPEKDYETGGGQ